ncbi:aquaporin [Clavulina sp. PMI_390]|nr:aquaporin [Clavulina sp. PMI_390]
MSDTHSSPEMEKTSISHMENNTTVLTHHSEQWERDQAYYTAYPNRWAFLRNRYIRDFASEFLGTMMIIIFGAGVDCQVVLSANTGVASSQKGSYLSISFGWAVGTAIGVWVGGASGGHINPVVTLIQAIFRGFPWKKVPVYMAGQLLGAWTGGLLIYANYSHAIAIVDPGKTQATASLFTTYSLDYMPSVACFFSEVLATAILLIAVLAVTDKRNGPPPDGLVPLVLFILILGEGAALGMETAYALNPARDLGPRIALAMVGYSKEVLFDYRHQYWLWTPILGPITGGILGTIVYDAFLFTGDESIFNKPNAAARLHHAHSKHAEALVIGKGHPIEIENVHGRHPAHDIV